MREGARSTDVRQPASQRSQVPDAGERVQLGELAIGAGKADSDQAQLGDQTADDGHHDGRYDRPRDSLIEAPVDRKGTVHALLQQQVERCRAGVEHEEAIDDDRRDQVKQSRSRGTGKGDLESEQAIRREPWKVQPSRRHTRYPGPRATERQGHRPGGYSRSRQGRERFDHLGGRD